MEIKSGNEGYYKDTNIAAMLELNGMIDAERVIDAEQFILVAGSSNTELSRAIARELKLPIQQPAGKFNDGETRIHFDDINFRGRDVLFIQSFAPTSQNDHIMELFFMADAVQRSNARSMSAVIPYMGYSRQERKAAPHEPISGPRVLQMLYNEFDMKSFLIVEPHAEAISGSIEAPVDFLPGSYVLTPAVSQYLAQMSMMDRSINPFINVMLAPDEGALKRAKKDAAKLNPIPKVGSILKIRDVHSVDNIETSGIMGLDSLEGENVVIFDDLIASGKTIARAAEEAKLKKAKQVIVGATHGVFTPGYEKYLGSDAIDHIFITDTIPQNIPDSLKGKMDVVSTAPMIAEAIRRNYTGESLSKKYYNVGNPGIVYV